MHGERIQLSSTQTILKSGVYTVYSKNVKPLKPTIAQVFRLLRMLEDKGLGYGAINTTRCALSLILPRVDGQTVGKHHLVHWFIHSV